MTTLTLKPQHETSAIGRALELKSQLEYHSKNIAPLYGQMEKFEQKEYGNVYRENELEFLSVTAYIKLNESLFNDLLSSYSLSVATFFNLFIIR